MKILKYMLKKQRFYLGTTALAFLFGVIFVFWGIDVREEIIKNTILVSVGTSLIAGGIVAILDLFSNVGREQVYRNIDNIILVAGVENTYNKRDLDEYDLLVENAQKSIDVMGYSLRGFYQSYKDILLKKTEQNREFKIRILLADPDSMSSKWREKNEDGKYKGVYKESLEVMKLGFADIDNIKIRVIDIPLGHMIYRIDDVMYVGPYFYKKNSKSTNTIRLSKEGWLFKEYQYEFDSMWTDSKSIK